MSDKKTDFLIGAFLGIFLYLFMLIFVIGLFIIFFGCAGAQKTAQEPLHAETGGGITIWKIPIVGIGGWGTNTTPDIIVYKYNYQTQPPPTPPGAQPSPPAVDYSTIYGSAWDDPSLVIFKNESYRRIKIQIDKQKPIALEPYGATANLHLDKGEHKIKIAVEKPTAAHGIWEDIRFFTINVSPSGHSQIFYIYE